MKPKTVVIGLGLFGREVALSLARRGYSVLAVDRAPEMVEQVKSAVDQALILDTTDESALREARIDEMAVAVCAIGTQHVENSILTTALLHQLGVPRIIVRAANDLHARILRQVGATDVVNPEQEMGRRVAHQIASPGIREVLSLAEGVCVAEVPTPPSFAGESLAGLDVRRKYGVNVIGVQRRLPGGATRSVGESTGGAEAIREVGAGAGELLKQDRRFIMNVSPTERLQADDILVVIGSSDDVKRLGGLG
ncbi:MAG: TrkA family potassium uptake protein [Kiritimatiellaeota bacterium]|nr:TrkA family potassium uptake protein [Kiritimatiellota bacterium]